MLALLANVMPETYILPHHKPTMVRAFSQSQNRLQNIWIVKPFGRAEKSGTYAVNQLSQVSKGENIAVQQFIRFPLLLDGRRFDLKMYLAREPNTSLTRAKR